ncbi:MAG: murein biosynthesis integral membrane protein MurJ [bacterium]
MKLFNFQTKGITTAAIILGAASIVSAFLGIFRDRLLAGKFGAGDELDVYYAAFRIPDFVSMVLIMGSISAALIPIFSEYITRNNKEAWKFLSNLFNVVIVVLIFVCLLSVIFAPQLINIITPGFSEDKKELVVMLTRIMFLSPIILGTSNIISSVLQVFRRFLITSLSPIMYNLGIIIGIVLFVPRLGISGLAWGVVLGAVLHLLIQISVLLKVGFRYYNIFDISDPGLRRMIKLTIPRSIGLAAGQINFFVVTAIASTLTSGGLAVFSLSESLSRPFIILTGIAFSTAAFPHLTLSLSKEKKERFLEIFSKTFNKILILIVPLSILLFIFREELVSFVFQVGRFGLLESRLTAACLAMFCFGLFAKALNLFIVRSFYALQDTRIPAGVSVISMFLNLFLCIIFVWLLSFPNLFQNFWINFLSLENLNGIEIVGLPLALSVSAIFQYIVLKLIFRTKLKRLKENGEY